MGQSSALANQFYRDVAKNFKLWTIRDERGFPAPLINKTQRAQPFWSSLARVQTNIKNVPAYSSFCPVELSWTEFRDKWLPGLERDGLLVGVNWSGKYATGYDVDPASVQKAIAFHISN